MLVRPWLAVFAFCKKDSVFFFTIYCLEYREVLFATVLTAVLITVGAPGVLEGARRALIQACRLVQDGSRLTEVQLAVVHLRGRIEVAGERRRAIGAVLVEVRVAAHALDTAEIANGVLVEQTLSRTRRTARAQVCSSLTGHASRVARIALVELVQEPTFRTDTDLADAVHQEERELAGLAFLTGGVLIEVWRAGVDARFD
jgi:hypothetical protein